MNPADRRDLNSDRSFLFRRPAEMICAGVLLLMALNFLAVISRKSLTNDEKYHIPAGYYHLVFGDFQLNPEHPPVVKMVGALPLLFIRPAAPPPAVSPAETPVLQGHDAFLAFWEANPDKVEAIAFWTRVPMIILTLLFGVLVFGYARYIAGGRAAVLAVVLFSLEPTILAHGRIVQTDVPAAFAYLLFFFLLQRLIDRQSLRRAIEFGLGAGLALVVKFSLLITLPVFCLSLLVLGWRWWRLDRRLSPGALRSGSAVIAAVLVINAAYYFERADLLPANREVITQEWPAHVTGETQAFDAVSQFVPPMYLFGALVVAIHNDWGHYASILGAHGRTGWWYYFPVAFALKTSVPFLLVSLGSLLWAAFVWRRDKRLVLPLVAIALYTAFSMSSRINIGVRHFLPVFSLLFVLGGVFLDWLPGLRRRRLMVTVIAIAISWMVVEAARSFPNYIPYMNELACRHPHWYYLSDSNVEWGDDTNALAQYLLDRGETRVRAAVSGGWLSKVQYGVDYVNPLVIDEPVEQTRYIAIGASFLNGSTVPLVRYKDGHPITEQQRQDFFAAYRDRVPEAVFGNSIYLFRDGD